MNNPVSFEISKLLKEKGFDEPCSHAYKEVESPILYMHQDKKYNNSFKKEWQNTVRKNSHMDNAVINRYSAPTIAEVVCWIYSKYNIWIQVSILKDDEWYYSIRRKENNWEIEFPTKEKFSSIEKAYEKGIEIVLNTYSPTS